MYKLKFDGGCAPKNPGGTASYGFILYKNDIEVSRGSGIIGQGDLMSNNLAEFYALYYGLQKFHEFSKENDKLLVQGDSNLVVNIMKGKWRAHPSKLYYTGYIQAKTALTFTVSAHVEVKFEWIPREKNQDCDDLTKTT